MRRLLALALLAAVAAVPAAAQQSSGQGRDSGTVRDHGFDYFYGPERIGVSAFQRGRLGIVVDLQADPARDTIGAVVAGVTPGGPAEKAGVETGDIVVSLNGTPLARHDSTRRGSGEEEVPSRPATRLLELASRLDPGDTVHLALRRDGRPLNVTLVTQESGMDLMTRRFDFGAPRRGENFRVRVPGGAMNFAFSGTPLASMELVNVNPGLAQYFGTSDGLLVVNVGSDSTLGLRSGDVILSIGGRKPGSPAHAMRILGTYDPNETVTFEVMRMKHHISVSGKMPRNRGGDWVDVPNAFDFDLGPLLKTPFPPFRSVAPLWLPLPFVRTGFGPPPRVAT
jgi:membrane-associated protease RseP (regulator of RpoE activity)